MMKKFRIGLNNKLNQCQDNEESLENLIEGYNKLKAKGGEARFIIYPKEGGPITTTLGEEWTKEIVKTLITLYNENIRSIGDEIVKEFNQYAIQHNFAQIGCEKEGIKK